MEMTHSFFMFHHAYCYCKFGVLYNLSRALKLITEIFDGFTDRSKAQNLGRENKLAKCLAIGLLNLCRIFL